MDKHGAYSIVEQLLSPLWSNRIAPLLSTQFSTDHGSTKGTLVYGQALQVKVDKLKEHSVKTKESLLRGSHWRPLPIS